MSDTNTGRDRSGCIKGCIFGCLGLVVISIAFFGIVGVLQFRAATIAEDPTQEERRRDLPPAPATASQLADARGSELELGDDSSSFAPTSLPTSGVGTIELDLMVGEFTIVPYDGDSIEIDADYDQARFELEEDFQDNGDGDWTYAISFSSKRRILGFRESRNRVEIRIPRGRPLNLTGEVKMGQSEIDLGGLWLGRVDLDVGMGQHSVDFSEPTPMPLESFSVEGRMGEVDFERLGNASPARIDVSHSMGQMALDLEGLWRGDGEVIARCRMGECTIHTPDDVNIETERFDVAMGGRSDRRSDEAVPEGAPTLRLDMKGSMGEIRIR